MMQRRQFISTTALGGLASLYAAPAGATRFTKADGELAALFAKLFDEKLELSPQNATGTGFDKGAKAALRSRLDDRSGAAQARSAAWHKSAAARLSAIAPAGLSAAARRQRELALWYCQQAVASARTGLANVQQPYPISQRDGAYFEIPDFLDSQHPLDSDGDAQAYLARLGHFAHALDQDVARQRELAPRGLIAPGWALETALGQLRALRGPAAAESTMVASLAKRSKTYRWSSQAASIIAQSVYPALDRQIAYLESLKSQTLQGDGIWRVKDGEAIYAAALAEATTTRFTPDEVHKIGLAQVAELTARLDAVLVQAGLTQGSVGARLGELNRRPDQLFPNTEEGRAALLASLNDGVRAMQARLAGAFHDLPDDPLEIRRVPPQIQDGAPNGYYYRAPLDNSRPAIYWINLRDTGDWPKYGLPDLTYHEGVPGHHLQISYVNHAGDLPLLLRDMSNSAYTEGWALYAEELAADLGAFSGVEQAGYLQSLLFRAARLVVDTGLHAKRWSRAQATAYMAATTGFPQSRCQSEVDRYICMIGQACSYKIGHNVWVSLRNKAKAQLGEHFSLAWFHDVLKEGCLPLAMLESHMDQRIMAAKAQYG